MYSNCCPILDWWWSNGDDVCRGRFGFDGEVLNPLFHNTPQIVPLGGEAKAGVITAISSGEVHTGPPLSKQSTIDVAIRIEGPEKVWETLPSSYHWEQEYLKIHHIFFSRRGRRCRCCHTVIWVKILTVFRGNPKLTPLIPQSSTFITIGRGAGLGVIDAMSSGNVQNGPPLWNNLTAVLLWCWCESRSRWWKSGHFDGQRLVRVMVQPGRILLLLQWRLRDPRSGHLLCILSSVVFVENTYGFEKIYAKNTQYVFNPSLEIS